MIAIPATAQILIVFAAVVAATARKVPLGLAAAAGGVALALWRGVPALEMLGSAAAAALSADTLLLLALMTCIMAFSSAMKRSSLMDAFAASLSAAVRSERLSMALAPAIIGTLPVPGGAVLSAPLVDAMDPGRSRGAATLSAANYWFRHTLELSWPLYPAFILTSSLTGVEPSRLILLNAYAPVTLFSLGLLFILPGGGRRSRDASQARGDGRHADSRRARLAAFVRGVAPLGIVLGTYGILAGLWAALSPALAIGAEASSLVGRYAPVFAGLACGSAYVATRPTGRGAFKGSLGPATVRLLSMMLGIKVFSALVGAAGAAEAAAAELSGAGFEPLVAIALLPFMAGLVTGVGFGYAGLAFPIILRMVPEGLSLGAVVVFAGAFGYAGMMLSPLHVCMVVSSEHFGVGLLSTIRRFAAPLGLFCAVASGYAALLAAFG